MASRALSPLGARRVSRNRFVQREVWPCCGARKTRTQPSLSAQHAAAMPPATEAGSGPRPCAERCVLAGLPRPYCEGPEGPRGGAQSCLRTGLSRRRPAGPRTVPCCAAPPPGRASRPADGNGACGPEGAKAASPRGAARPALPLRVGGFWPCKLGRPRLSPSPVTGPLRSGAGGMRWKKKQTS